VYGIYLDEISERSGRPRRRSRLQRPVRPFSEVWGVPKLQTKGAPC